jgi:hypothetical protein
MIKFGQPINPNNMQSKYFTFLWLKLCWMGCSIFCSTLQAQDASYIATYPNTWTTSLYVQARSIELSIKPQEANRSQEIVYKPNVASVGGFGIVFKKIALRLGFQLTRDAQSDDKFGKSRYFDLQLHSFGRKTAFDAYLQDYQGYFMNNPQTVFADWQSETFPQRADLNIFNLGGNATYIFNADKFSYRAVFVFDEAQRKSAGSFLLTGSLNYAQLKADSSLIPSDTQIDFAEETDFSQAQFYNLSLIPGYTYTLVLGRSFYLNLGLSMNLGLRYQQFGLNEWNHNGLVPSFKALGRAGVGYNGKRFFVGWGLIIDSQTARLAATHTGTTSLSNAIFLGYRFPTKILQNYESIWKWLFEGIF